MPNPKEIFECISESIGAGSPSSEDQGGLSVSSYEQKEVARADDFRNVEEEIKEQQLSDDYFFVRKQLQDTVETAQSALQNAVEVAGATGNPEIISSVASMVLSVISASRALMDLQHQVSKTKVTQAKILSIQQDEEPGSTTNNFFIGSTDEMLQALELAQERKRLTIDGEFTQV